MTGRDRVVLALTAHPQVPRHALDIGYACTGDGGRALTVVHALAGPGEDENPS